MDTNLAKILVRRGVIRQGTVLEAYQTAKGLSGVCDSFEMKRYIVVGASTSGAFVYFTVASSATERQRIRCDFVVSLDGMMIERVASAHQLREDGSEIKAKARRSRTKRPLLFLPVEHELVEAVPAEAAQHGATGDCMAHHDG